MDTQDKHNFRWKYKTQRVGGHPNNMIDAEDDRGLAGLHDQLDNLE
jgi:hypothetical protein